MKKTMNNVHIVNKIDFERKLNKIKSEGCRNLRIISDWDSTLTKKFFKNKPVGSSFAKIKNHPDLGKDYFLKAEALRKEYDCEEFKENISFDFKSKKMLDWWEKHLDLLITSGMHKDIVIDFIKKKEIHSREGFTEFLSILQKEDISLFIISAGLGDFIKEFLIYEKKLTDNIYIISNFFEFNEFGRAIGYTKPIIHNLNKRNVLIYAFSQHKDISDRKNIVILGDSVEDAKVVNNIDDGCTIKIGFLNDNSNELIEKYSEIFDVIILNDSSLNYVNDLLRTLTSASY